MPQTHDVNFFSGPGLRIAARLYSPSAKDDRGRGIVFCHGFGGTKEGTPPGLATLLAERGYTVLTFDYRGFGQSEGQAGRLVPYEQIEDAVHALEFLARSQAVEPDRIGLYGNSFGGGIAIAAAARSHRCAAAVVVVPVISGQDWLRGIMRHYEFEDLQKATWDAIADKATRGEIRLVDRFDIMVPDPQTRAAYDEPLAMPLETFWHVLNHEPLTEAERLRIPVAVIGMRGDRLVPFEQALALYEQLGGPKHLHVFESDQHFSVYGELLAETGDRTASWFDQYLA